ncbi:MAG: hypothetical protein KGI64_02700 [Xanthomonadaceae bacterium]|nr:hypothetical protein [Xanthomonadaceae bacterium]MDE2083751.1 hypothetical protein [Xanthomonadaceae bacterium]MDE2258353.1 hypothetical protein [Xanthomonadaceae bacterium]
MPRAQAQAQTAIVRTVAHHGRLDHRYDALEVSRSWLRDWQNGKAQYVRVSLVDTLQQAQAPIAKKP